MIHDAMHSDHDYALHEQADLVEALWAREGVSETVLVGHDYAVSATQEPVPGDPFNTSGSSPAKGE